MEEDSIDKKRGLAERPFMKGDRHPSPWLLPGVELEGWQVLDVTGETVRDLWWERQEGGKVERRGGADLPLLPGLEGKRDDGASWFFPKRGTKDALSFSCFLNSSLPEDHNSLTHLLDENGLAPPPLDWAAASWTESMRTTPQPGKTLDRGIESTAPLPIVRY